MTKQHLQPPELFESQRFGYTQVVTSPPGTQVFVAGQGAFDREFALIGGDDVGAQTQQALSNLGHALRAAGAGASDVTSLRIYVVDFDAQHALSIGQALRAFFGEGSAPAQTLIGVQALGVPGMRVEIEATAVVEG